MRILPEHKAAHNARLTIRRWDRELAPPCAAWPGKGGCDNKATWGAWSAHATDHEEMFAYCCDDCKAIAEEYWERHRGLSCVCGYTIVGTIDQHLRFIRL